MNRNVESHFAELPSVGIQRSMFDRSFGHQTTMNIGDVVPIYWSEVVPGDTVKLTTSSVVRLQTLLAPIFSNIYMDTYFFFVPMRLVWQHTKEFFGENRDSPWVPQVNYTVPICSYPDGGFAVGTIADYMGVPTGVSSNNKADWPIALPFRAVALICDQWFRDQNVSDPLNIPMGDSDTAGSNGSNYINDVAKGGMPFKAAKYHDYFTSALPYPLKADQNVAIQFADIDHYFPTGTMQNNHDFLLRDEGNAIPLRTGALSDDPTGSSYVGYRLTRTGSSTYDAHLVPSTAQPTVTQLQSPVNLWTHVEYSSDLTINDLRLCFQLQKFYESCARSGTRYRELIKGMFNVTSPDARMQIPEYLGGHRFPLNIHQVTNTAQGENDFLGDLGAMSNTADVHDDVIFSSTEHGYLIGLAVCRYDHSYPQGLSKEWSRRSKLDYMWPVFSHLGEMPIKKREICFKTVTATGVGQAGWDDNNKTFGYQEQYAEYRYQPSRVSAEMRPGIANSLATWHLSDYYETVPSLSDSWIREDKANVDRVLAVTSSVSHQVLADFYFKAYWTRPLPMFSVPGLVDHF